MLADPGHWTVLTRLTGPLRRRRHHLFCERLSLRVAPLHLDRAQRRHDGEVEFALCDATLTQGSGKERHTVFRGQIFRLTLPRKRLSTTVVLRNSGWLNRFECPPGLKPVGLEDPKFNQAFAARLLQETMRKTHGSN